MARDRLFLLPPGFEDPALDDGGKGWVCPYCMMVEGYLATFPALRDLIDITYLPFKRPRQPVAELIGEDHQALPVLILAEPSDADGVETANGHAFISDERAMMRYLAARHGLAPPHP